MKHSSRLAVTSGIGLLSTVIGLVFILSARNIAWPTGGIQYSGPYENTSWAFTEHAVQYVGLLIASFGLILLLLFFRYFLSQKSNDKSSS